VPFNDGVGGEAVDLVGASGNEHSNFYPDFSPDGRWLVFAKADRGFFSQMSGDLWIVPAEGGQARRLNCSSQHAESWHRFSPDGKWLAFITNREDIRLPDIWMSRFDSDSGQCAPAIQIPHISGPGAHVHAFDWSVRFPWLDEGLDIAVLTDPPPGAALGGSDSMPGGESDRRDGHGPDGGGPRVGTPMAAPQAVQTQVDALVAAITQGKPDAVESLFISRDLFLEVSDCKPNTVVNDVMNGRSETADRANRELSDDPNRAADLRDLRLFDGRMLVVNKGDKPERCRAKRDVRLFQTSWSWSLDGNQESGEAHLLEIDGRWYFAKF
jgi:dipeptidyl aminopeptidase/acylaminoacyl peptidase